jgi:membrane fusion protein (multidrug efflux system)
MSRLDENSRVTKEDFSNVRKQGSAIELRAYDVLANAPASVRIGERIARWTFRVLSVVLAIAACGLIALPVRLSTHASGVLWPETIMKVRSPMTGVVAMILVTEGDSVTAGQPIIRLDSVPLATESLQVDAKLAAARLSLDRILSGAPAAARARRLQEAQAAERVIRLRAALAERLVLFGVRTYIDSVLQFHEPGRHTEIDRSVAELREAMLQLDATRTAESDSVQSHIATVEARTAISQAVAQMKLVNQKRGQLTIRSPISGHILSPKVEDLLGAYVQTGELLVQVGKHNSWRAELVMRDSDIGAIHLGDSVLITIPALRRLTSKDLFGRVSQIGVSKLSDPSHESSSSPATYLVDVSIPSTDLLPEISSALRPGYAVEARIVSSSGRIGRLIYNESRFKWRQLTGQ